MTVVQNVAYGLSGRPRHTRARRARQMLELVHLAHVAERFPHQLSGGEQQRVALARSLAPQPVALLLDEPFSNLDPQLRVQLRAELRGILRSSGVTSIYVTHDQEEALYMGDRVAVMNAGRIEQVGTPEDIFHHPHSRFVARFLGLADFIPARASEDGLATDIGLLHTPTHLAPGTEVEVMVRPDDVGIRPLVGGTGTGSQPGLPGHALPLRTIPRLRHHGPQPATPHRQLSGGRSGGGVPRTRPDPHLLYRRRVRAPDGGGTTLFPHGQTTASGPV